MPFDALFIRHAESLADVGATTDHPAQYALTDRGRQQAATFAKATAVVPQVIVHSPYLRAEQTALPLASRFPSVSVLKLPVHEFTYLDPEQWRGTNTRQRQPAVQAYWAAADPGAQGGEAAESFFEMFARVEATLAWLEKTNTGPIFVFSHELFIRATMWRTLMPSLEAAANTMAAFRAWQLAAPLPPLSMTRLISNQAGEIVLAPPFRFKLTNLEKAAAASEPSQG